LGKLRTFLLWIPFLSFFAATAETFFSPIKTTLLTNDYAWAIIANIFFLNAVHLVFTFIIILKNDNFKLYAKKYILKDPFFFLVISVFFVFLSLDFLKIIDSFYLIVFTALYSMHHGWAQFNGIYNFAFTPKRTFLVSSIRFLSLVLTLLIVVAEYVGYLQIHNTGNLTYLLLSICLITPLILMQYCLKKSASEAVFLFRYLTFTLIPLSYVANINQSLIHGLEYFVVYSFFVTKDTKKYLLSFFPITMILFIITLCLINEHRTFSILQQSPITKYFVYLLTFVTFLHFYLDRRLYRMHDPHMNVFLKKELDGIKFVN
jgi:hypothetical protein